eukprot:scaffold26414_cov24-Prasinocladus_malaysianus.AAC.1
MKLSSLTTGAHYRGAASLLVCVDHPPCNVDPGLGGLWRLGNALHLGLLEGPQPLCLDARVGRQVVDGVGEGQRARLVHRVLPSPGQRRNGLPDNG